MTKGDIIIEGAMPFCDLYTPGGAPGYPSKFSVTIQVAKGSTHEKDVFDAVQDVCQRTWPDQWEAKLAAVHKDIMDGAKPMDSKISLSDGDQIQPDYNAGFWVVKASRRTNQGPPSVYTKDGVRVHGDAEAGAPAPGWGVSAWINVWAMKSQSRVNFTVIAVQGVQQGVKLGGPTPQAIEAGTAAFLAAPKATQIPGVIEANAGNAPIPAQVPQSVVPQSGPPAASIGLTEDEEGGVLEL